MSTDITRSPRVSIVTGFYNRGHLLDASVESILTQTYENTEVIVFDDCSVDDTAERLRRLQERYDHLRVILHAENVGFAKGLTGAIGVASGEYIAIHGSGDISHPQRIARQAEVLMRRPDVGVVGSFYENVVAGEGLARRRRIVADGIRKEDLLRGNVFSHGEVMFRRSVYDRVGGYRPVFHFALDYDLWLRMVDVTEFSTVREFLYCRYIQADGASYAPTKRLRQIQYLEVARTIAVLPKREAEAILGTLESDGLDAVVPRDDDRLQPEIRSSALRALVWGQSTEAQELSRMLRSRWQTAGIVFLARIWSTLSFTPIRLSILRLLGVYRSREAGLNGA